ncbi:hypothetical protein CLCR_10772 [Cladophialophora carrionii]|uniref:Uncharacterized protein n=1 Tax=Cladophialophora carrionii TaxID=86049 RepID=A0A1C1CVQ1_9EURO|nr:hypothetical protein CLCR_10772 [Cladophialophora carrionii]
MAWRYLLSKHERDHPKHVRPSSKDARFIPSHVDKQVENRRIPSSLKSLLALGEPGAGPILAEGISDSRSNAESSRRYTEEEEDMKRRYEREREAETQHGQGGDPVLSSRVSEQRNSDRNRPVAKRASVMLSACPACNGLGGRADKIRECTSCKELEKCFEHNTAVDKADIRAFQLLCEECNGQGTTIKEKYRCKVCNGDKVLPVSLPRDRERVSPAAQRNLRTTKRGMSILEESD